MKISTVFSTAGIISLLFCGAALAQTLVPVGSAANVNRSAAGKRAGAAALPPPASVEPAPVAAAGPYSWTGFYIGGDFGGSFASATLTSATPGWPSRSVNASGVMGGGYVGYNYQLSPNFVLGVEGDMQGDSSSVNSFYPAFDVTPSFEQNWVASLNGRLGFVYDRALIYAIGGGAWGQASGTITPGFVLFHAPAQPISRTADMSGWDVGAGVDYAFTPHWVGRLEYRYYDFGSFDLKNVGAYQPVHVSNSINTVRIGLSYLFSAPAPVIAAKY
jgi:outer membrane immunogenic protein